MFRQISRNMFKTYCHYCVIVLVLSTVIWSEAAQAQQNLPNVQSLQGLLGQLNQMNTQPGAPVRTIERPKGSRFASNKAEDNPDKKTGKTSPFTYAVEDFKSIQAYCANRSKTSDSAILHLEGRISALEKDYCRRAGLPLFQFGYNLFADVNVKEVFDVGTIRDNYQLGIGDEIVVSFYGHDTNTHISTVDGTGMLTIGEFQPKSVVGMSLGDLRRWIVARSKKSLFKTKPVVSLGGVRLLHVTVAGEVLAPGVHQLSSLSSVLDALSKAGGISKNGSFRKLQIFRGQDILWIDIYDILLARDGGQDLSLRDGDKIVVPTIGYTVGIAGEVLRPGIYELAEGQDKIEINEIIALAGGTVRPVGNLTRLLSFNSAGTDISSELTDNQTQVSNSDLILVSRQTNFQEGIVELSGHVRTPGKRALTATPTVKSLLRNSRVFLENPYMLFAVLETTDPGTLSRLHFPINLTSIVTSEKDYSLRDGDRLIVFGQKDIRFLTSRDVREILQPSKEKRVPKSGKILQRALTGIENVPGGPEETSKKDDGLVSSTELMRDVIRKLAERGIISGDDDTINAIEQDLVRVDGLGCRGLQALSKIVAISGSSRFRNAILESALEKPEVNRDSRICPRIFDEIPDLLPFALEHLTVVNGEVRVPGGYPIVPETPLSLLISVAGNLTRNADLSIVDVSRFLESGTIRERVDIEKSSAHDIRVNPGELIDFHPRYSDRDKGSIFLSGEFARAGKYDITRGEKLSEVIKRAGGLTAQAYPYGAVFTRESVKLSQKAGFKRAARELKASAMHSLGTKGANASAFLALESIQSDIENAEALGRVVIEADPTVLQVRPELDTVVEPGDRILMPKRPGSVMIIGDVLNPGALQFIAGTKVDQYVQHAGGMHKSADEDRVFLVFPNGSAQPVTLSVWNYSALQVPPGSTIVVPKDTAPLDIFTFAKDMTTLISQMAITAASLAVIGNN
jgi:polysaccharide biosynthesis/export protein